MLERAGQGRLLQLCGRAAVAHMGPLWGDVTKTS